MPKISGETDALLIGWMLIWAHSVTILLTVSAAVDGQRRQKKRSTIINNEDTKKNLRFINIRQDNFALDTSGDAVDFYGYFSMAVAAIQRETKKSLARKKWGVEVITHDKRKNYIFR